jgi:hypothetical protein
VLSTTTGLAQDKLYKQNCKVNLMFFKFFGKLFETVLRIVLARMIEATLKKLVHFVPTIFPASNIKQWYNAHVQKTSSNRIVPATHGRLWLENGKHVVAHLYHNQCSL